MFKRIMLFLLKLCLRIILLAVWAGLRLLELIFGTIGNWLKDIISKPLKL